MGELLDLGLDKVPPPVLMSEKEHKLRIDTAVKKLNTNDKPFISLSFKSITEPDASRVYDQLWLPYHEDDQDKINNKKRRISQFCENFKVNVIKGSLDVDNMLGCTGFATIKQEKDDEGELRANIGGYTGGK